MSAYPRGGPPPEHRDHSGQELALEPALSARRVLKPALHELERPALPLDLSRPRPAGPAKRGSRASAKQRTVVCNRGRGRLVAQRWRPAISDLEVRGPRVDMSQREAVTERPQRIDRVRRERERNRRVEPDAGGVQLGRREAQPNQLRERRNSFSSQASCVISQPRRRRRRPFTTTRATCRRRPRELRGIGSIWARPAGRQ